MRSTSLEAQRQLRGTGERNHGQNRELTNGQNRELTNGPEGHGEKFEEKIVN